MAKLISVVKHVDVRGYIVCKMYVMYVSVRNLQKSVVPFKLSMGRLVSVVKHIYVYGLYAVCNVRERGKLAKKA